MRGLLRDVRHYVTQLEEMDKAIAEFLPRFECTLNTIPGVSDTTVAKLLSEIGDIRRFPNAEKQDRVCYAKSAGQRGLKAIFCSKDRENMVKFLAVKIIALESVDFFESNGTA